MVFGHHSGKAPPPLDFDGHHHDPNITSPYTAGPSRDGILSPGHPDYDPMVDPNLQLRTVRTAAESIAESHRSEQRREDRKRAKKRGEQGQSILGKFGRGRSMLRRDASRKGGVGSAIANMVHDEMGHKRHASGASGTGGEGVGVAFDSAQQYKTPLQPTMDAGEEAEREAELEVAEESDEEEQDEKSGSNKVTGKRRNIYLNMPLASNEVNRKGEPLAIYPRNKVRTSKYTVVTFLPRFLFEQFRRIANIYFLGLVVLQVFPTFGATVPQIAMLPLVAILGITAIKDSIEDYRRHVLDNQVNNSAVTKLGGWRNVNQPRDSRSWFQKFFNLSGRGSGKVSKGVRKLREKEDAIGMRVVPGAGHGGGGENDLYNGGQTMARGESGRTGRSGSVSSAYALETIMSESERGGPDDSGSGTVHQQFPGMNRSVSSNTMLQGSSMSLGGHGSVAEGVVDYARHTPGTARWERTLWKKLEVGDVVLLRDDDQVPADIVVLNSSDPDGNAYIETKNLDGETNLKVRKSLKATMGIQSEEDIEHARFVIDSEPPHANLYSYNGLLKYTATGGENGESGDKPTPADSSAAAAAKMQSRRVEPVTINELLLRGCAIRNTEWVIGLVVFTGDDTKIMLNGGETPSKRSKIEKETNFNVLMNFIILMAMCTICAVVGGLQLNQTNTSRNYYEQGAEVSDSNVVNALIIFGSCLVVFQNIVPISLYISIEIVKTIQAFFIYQDADMYYAPLDYPCVPKTWNISDDLGQIEYIFSDKTGTLTQNVMEFKKCSINGVSYGEGVTEAMMGAAKRQGKDTSQYNPREQEAHLQRIKAQMISSMTRSFKNRYLRPDQLTLISPSLADQLAPSSTVHSEQRKNIVAFFRALALCHTALADRQDASDPFMLDYKAQSPDEAALVSAARDVGAVFISKNNTTVDIEVMGQPERYTPLRVLEFNSTRKRMSVIVREPDGRILMICKGADSVIYQRLRADHPQELQESTQRDLEDFANAGLRTLCIAYRYLDEGEFTDWARVYDEAAASLTDRDEAIDQAAEEIEHDLTLLGATALEDKLQVGVPDAIEMLHKAGIKLWILTGDKLQTAIEIGFSCNLLSSEMEIMIISADHEQGTRAQIEAACNKIASAGRPVVVEEPVKGKSGMKKKRQSKLDIERTENAPAAGFAVVIDGETLRYALDPSLKPLFLALTTQCETVVCCRVSPAQKALTVKLVKEGKDAMTLAIGDGANDVAMIQEAHCGVGIAGLEGAQASMSADYAIGQFRFLTKLLLVHGHWSYVRIADMHKVFFYKNIIWTFTMFWFQIFSGFDATYLYDYSYVLLFNLVFTSLPVIILGALDQDVHPKAIFAYPGTYKRGIAGLEYTRGLFWSAVIDAVYQSAICFFIPYCIWALFPVSSADGLDLGSLWFFGTTIGAGAVISANLYAGLTMRFWTWIFWAIEAISILSYFVWALIYSAFPTWLYDDVAYWLYATVIFWTTVLLVVVLCLLPRFFFKAWRIAFNPTEVDIVRESWVKGDLKEQLGLREKKSYNMTDVETGNDLFVAAKNSTERSRSHLAADDNISETSADPFPTDYEQHYVRYDGNPNPTNPNSRVVRSPDDELEELNDPYQDQAQSSRSPPHDSSPGERTGTAFSFYDPERLPSASPQMMTSPHAHSHSAHKQQQQGQQQQQDAHNRGFEVPSINVQRASVQSYEVGQAISPDGEASYGYPAYSGAATSTTHLAEKSTDSFNAQFEEAFGPHSPGAGQEAMAHLDEFASADPYVTGNGAPTPTQRAYHDRFREQSPPAATPTQAHHHYPQPQLNAHQQEDSGASWHTAGDHDPTQHDGWRDR